MSAKHPLRVVITEASDYIARSLAYRILSDDVFGSDQQIILCLFDNSDLFLESISIEITACAPALLKDIVHSNDPAVAFKDADVVFSIGTARDYNFTDVDIRRDPFFRDYVLETKNNALAIQSYAKKDAKVVTLGNTAARLISEYAPSLPKENITAVTLAIQRFVTFHIAKKTKRLASDVKNLIVWGTNSKKALPCCNYAKIDGDRFVIDVIKDDEWCKKTLPKLINNLFSKCHYRVSEALALADHCKFLIQGTPDGEWTNMSVVSDGSYGVTPGVYFSFPVYCTNGRWDIVKDLHVEDYCRSSFGALLAILEKRFAIAMDICSKATVKKHPEKKPQRSSLKSNNKVTVEKTLSIHSKPESYGVGYTFANSDSSSSTM
ncbi:malate dehydrogenase, cytoplasmic-like [Copidosoma floridanum]|uniref:malate dehydrogenase, cytoplasmic-like n=1 Tax=Copidosoma floridanum TaxID=29053 RepID=UPI0006C981F5|nr:malate dehydrogenase, cytoplasmic-like [Copidosoma floridanum]